jgi:hypothetical protein
MMMHALILGAWEVVLVLSWPTLWGLGFALWERFRLAPRRRLATGLPAFFSGSIPAAVALAAAAISFFESRADAAELLLISLGLFIALSIAGATVFLVSRRLLRTHFTHDNVG